MTATNGGFLRTRLGKARDPEQARFRVVSTAIHEVGHMLGLPHCPVLRCVMNDARGTVKTVDNSTGHLCLSCRAAIAKRLRKESLRSR